jgi:hypothetical protein
MDQIAYCGHHCGHCPYTECPGCRSENPFCSFATLFEDRQCPNVKCCLSRGLDGCYDCAELPACRIGFFDTKEQVAKATALFIHQYGKESFDRTLSKAIAAGVQYPTQFNEMGDVGKMVNLLRENM